MNDNAPSVCFVLPYDQKHDGPPKHIDSAEAFYFYQELIADQYREEAFSDLFYRVRADLFRAAGGLDNLSFDDIDEVQFRAREIVCGIFENTPPWELPYIPRELPGDDFTHRPHTPESSEENPCTPDQT